MHNSIDAIEKTLVPIVNKLLCSSPGDALTRNLLPGKDDLIVISKHLSELYVQYASNNKVAHRLKKVRIDEIVLLLFYVILYPLTMNIQENIAQVRKIWRKEAFIRRELYI